MPELEPTASRPYMPGYGVKKSKKGLLSWRWAAERLEAAKTFWLATVWPDGRPHLTPVSAVWDGSRLVFSASRRTRKHKNLSANGACSIAIDTGAEQLIVEGVAEEVTDPDRIAAYRTLTRERLGFDLSGMELGLAGEPVYAVRPTVAFGFGEDLGTTATRWTFPH
jgi:hypothetical protein